MINTHKFNPIRYAEANPLRQIELYVIVEIVVLVTDSNQVQSMPFVKGTHEENMIDTT